MATVVEQINALVYCTGDQTDDIFLEIGGRLKETKIYDDIVMAFEDNLVVKTIIGY